jgi:predicted DNA-binding transcriptional regulator YafY
MERLVRLIIALNHAEFGSPMEKLMRIVLPEGNEEAQKKAVSRDIEHLNNLGYDISNVAEPGAEGVYKMRARDNRLQVYLTADQRGELLRAAVAAGMDDMGGHLGGHLGAASAVQKTVRAAPHLDLVQRGMTQRCLLRFTYKATPRVVHPVRVHSGPSGWYLSGREEGQEVVKEFVVSRMREVSLAEPGTAEFVEQSERPSLDPLGWRIDAPTDVVIEVETEHRVLAENLLGDAADVKASDDVLRMRYVVTHRAVFRWRIYELGTRVHVLSPDEVRRELLDELSTVAGVPA